MTRKKLGVQVRNHNAPLRVSWGENTEIDYRDLQGEYLLLQALNDFLGKNIKFNEFGHIWYYLELITRHIAIKSDSLGINLTIESDAIHNLNIWPGMLGDFLKANGAVEKKPGWGPLPEKQLIPGIVRPKSNWEFNPRKKTWKSKEPLKEKKWVQEDGKWVEMVVEIVNYEKLAAEAEAAQRVGEPRESTDFEKMAASGAETLRRAKATPMSELENVRSLDHLIKVIPTPEIQDLAEQTAGRPEK